MKEGQLDNLRKILKELELEKLLNSEFLSEITLKKFKEDTMIDLYGKKLGSVWYIAEGSIEGIQYYGKTGIAKFFIDEKCWFGFEEAILDEKLGFDIVPLKGCILLEIPLKKILESPTVKIKTYKIFMKHMATSIKQFADYIINKIGYSDEGFFLKYLEKNNYKITYKSQKDLADTLLINSRTFQRILKVLDKEKIINIRRGTLVVVEIERFYSYIKKNSIWV